MTMLGRRMLGVTALLVTALAISAQPVTAGGDWNDAQIKWQPYEAGLAAAKKDKKPAVLIFYTEWCPHCTNYAKLFHDPKVVEKAKQFVMIRLDKDKNPEPSKKVSPDGEYIPRTYFVAPDGTVDQSITAPRPEYKYFYDERDPAQLLAAMDTALKKLK
jgi:thiol:disulfide interchange protein